MYLSFFLCSYLISQRLRPIFILLLLLFSSFHGKLLILPFLTVNSPPSTSIFFFLFLLWSNHLSTTSTNLRHKNQNPQAQTPSIHKHRSPPPTPIHKHLDPIPSTHKLWSSATITDPSIHKRPTPAPICLSVGLFAWVCLCISVLICLCVCVYVLVILCLCVYEEKDDEERSQFVLHKEEREKKFVKCEINKIMVYTNCGNCAYIHGYYSKCVNIHSYYSKCVNIHSFRSTDVKDFWSKMCKICYFLYFVNFYIYWCGYSNLASISWCSHKKKKSKHLLMFYQKCLRLV